MVGSGCYFLNYVHIPHDCVVGDHVVMSNSVQVGGHADIGDWVVVGGLTGIHQFTRIGCHAMIGFGYRVIQDIPPYVLAAGEPLRPMGINKTGLERRGFSAAAIDNVRKIYGIFYRQRLKRSEALSKIREELPDSPEAECFVSFVENSERGIMR